MNGTLGAVSAKVTALPVAHAHENNSKQKRLGLLCQSVRIYCKIFSIMLLGSSTIVHYLGCMRQAFVYHTQHH